MATVVPPKRNTAFVFELAVFDYSGKLLTAATFSARQISKDGGAYATTTNAPTEIGTSGTYIISLTATEMDADRITLRFVIASNPDITVNLFTVARQNDDLAYPAVSGRSIDVDASGKLLLQATQTGVTIPTVTTLSNAPSDSAGVTTLLSRFTAARAGYLDNLNTFLDATISSVATLVNAIKAKTDNLPASPAATGAQMDFVNAPNATAITAIQSGMATASALTTLTNRIGAWTGTGRNTVLGALQALFRKDADATVPSDINANLGSGAGSANNTTDSTEAIRDNMSAGGTYPTAVDIADEVQTRTIAAVTTVTTVTTVSGNVNGTVASVVGDVGGNLVGNVQGTVPDSAGMTTLLSLLTEGRALLLDNLGALAGFSGTLLNVLRAAFRSDASSADIGGTFDSASDSLQAIRTKVDELAAEPPQEVNVEINELDS